jgi:predicted RNase H-like nuclease
MAVAGVDGTPGGWAVVVGEEPRWRILKVARLYDIFAEATDLDIVAVDVPIGLCDAYEIGGRACDRAARKYLRKRGSSVFPAPVRRVLAAGSWEDACTLSRNSAPHGKAITKQTFAILPKIKEVDDLLRTRPDLCRVICEVHPEVSFRELAGQPMAYPKRKPKGREDRRNYLGQCVPDLNTLIESGREQHLPLGDILDATVACWSALRLAAGKGRGLVQPVPHDTTGLPMTIWV